MFDINGNGMPNCVMPLTGFKNLTSLELYNFYGAQEEPLINEIVSLLSRCPQLKKLGLGLASDSDVTGNPEILIHPQRCDFLERLCIKYGCLEGALPLRLTNLRLGHRMFLYESLSTSVGNYIAKLINIEEIRTLHVFNGHMAEGADGNATVDAEAVLIDWSLLDACKLRQLSASRMESDVRRWLNSRGNTVEELIVCNIFLNP
jgi:hypothetical protein